MPPCPICRSASGPRAFMVADGKAYLRCEACEATWLDPAFRLSLADERAHYDLHENAVDDPGYRRFLARLADPLCARLAPGAQGLDYGCGPGPALAAMLEERGHETALYDPAYAPDATVLQRRYAFVTCTETAEHFHDPAGQFDRLAGLLEPGGVLAVMTCFQTDDARFATWWYRKDPTHVVFYREATLVRVAEARGLAFDSPAKDIAFMTKPR